jgi:hypothetical protein
MRCKMKSQHSRSCPTEGGVHRWRENHARRALRGFSTLYDAKTHTLYVPNVSNRTHHVIDTRCQRNQSTILSFGTRAIVNTLHAPPSSKHGSELKSHSTIED